MSVIQWEGVITSTHWPFEEKVWKYEYMEPLVTTALSAKAVTENAVLKMSIAQSSTVVLLRHLFLAKGIVPPFFVVLGKVINGWPHLLSPADCPCRWRSLGLGYRDTRRTCNTDPSIAVGGSGSSGTPETGRPHRCHSDRCLASLA